LLVLSVRFILRCMDARI